MMGRFDSNRNGRLELSEAQRLSLPVTQMDTDGDGEVSRDELHVVVAAMQEEAGDVTEGVPGWFYELDANRDGQIALREFAKELTTDRLDEFESFDINSDGLLTVSEVKRSSAVTGGSYRNDTAEVLPPFSSTTR